MVISDHIDCDCAYFDYTCWAIELHVGVAWVEDNDNFIDKSVRCHSMGIRVNDSMRTVSMFAIPRMSLFRSGFQYSVPGFSHNVSFDPRSKHQFKTWMSFSPQVLFLPTHQDTISFSRMVTKRNYQKYNEIL